MQMSPNGLKLLMQREGVRLTAYQDVRGIFTIGVGHTSVAGPPTVLRGMKITEDEAQAIFAKDVQKFEIGVSDAIKRVATQAEFDAMVSLAYNIGVAGFTGSTVVHKFNSGFTIEAANAFLMWEIPAALAARRVAERKQFLGE